MLYDFVQSLMLFLDLLVQEGFDHVYSTVNKEKKTSNQPSQETGKTESSKSATTSLIGINNHTVI